MCAVRLGRCVTNLGRGRATNIDIPTGRKLLDRVDKTVISFVGSCLSSLPNIRKVTTSQLTWRSGKLETVVAVFTYNPSQFFCRSVKYEFCTTSISCAGLVGAVWAAVRATAGGAALPLVAAHPTAHQLTWPTSSPGQVG